MYKQTRKLIKRNPPPGGFSIYYVPFIKNREEEDPLLSKSQTEEGDSGDDDLNVDQHQTEGQHNLQWMDALIGHTSFAAGSGGNRRHATSKSWRASLEQGLQSTSACQRSTIEKKHLNSPA